MKTARPASPPPHLHTRAATLANNSNSKSPSLSRRAFALSTVMTSQTPAVWRREWRAWRSRAANELFPASLRPRIQTSKTPRPHLQKTSSACAWTTPIRQVRVVTSLRRLLGRRARLTWRGAVRRARSKRRAEVAWWRTWARPTWPSLKQNYSSLYSKTHTCTNSWRL